MSETAIEPSPSAIPAAPDGAPSPVVTAAQAAADGPFDVLVIGAGPGGYIAAFRAAQLGLRTIGIEREYVGGVCLNVGCIPSKSLLKNASVMRLFKDAKTYGVEVGELKADYGKAVGRSREVVKRFVNGVRFLYRKNKVELVEGEAKLVSKDADGITVAVGDRQIKTRNVIVATGSRPNFFPGMEIDGEVVQNSWQTVVNPAKPERIVIVGGGIISCEMATVFSSYGSEVTILEALPHLLPGMEERISSLLERSFSRQGIKFVTGVRVESARREGDRAKIVYGKDGKQETLEADRCLIAVGVKPNSDGFGLEALGVELERGFIKVDARMQTNVPGVYAIGDVALHPYALAHVASAEGVQAANAIAGHQVRPLNYDNMPRPVFSHPQVAAIGLTEAQARERGYEVKVGEFPFSALGKAVAENDFEGVVRMVVDAKYGEILGCHIIGPEATELLAQVTPFKVLEGTSHEFEETVVSHPTLNESVKHAALMSEGAALEI
ncbi:MAG TPA: dihydrolipoyl dehydrogenase [Chloroflexota bacterium]|nr:dihydrolipoyl dehydrogenase [Chloroflexota bacterium]